MYTLTGSSACVRACPCNMTYIYHENYLNNIILDFDLDEHIFFSNQSSCETLVLDDVMCLNCAIWFTKYQRLKSITYRGSCELSGCHLSMFVMINRETLQVFDVTGAEIITCLQCIAQLEIIDSPGNKPIQIVINTERIEGALSINPVIDVSHSFVIFTDVAQKN